MLKLFAKEFGIKKSYNNNNSININSDQGLFYIRSGAVKLLYGNNLNKVIAVDIYKEGEFFGYVDRTCSADEFQLKVVFLEDTELIFLDNETLHLHASMNRELRMNFIKTIGKLVQHSTERIINLAIMKKRETIFGILHYLITKFGKVLSNGKIMVTVKLNDTDIKELCNSSREYVSRTLSTLKNEGILEKKNGYFIISSKEDLNSLICAT